jgi:hypothetical protein
MRQLIKNIVSNFLPGLMLLLATLFTANAQQPTYSFQSKLSADSILIGDRVELSILVSLPKGYNVQFPMFADTLVKGIEVIGQPKIDTVTSKTGEVEFRYTLNLTSFEQGFYRIPQFSLPFSSDNIVDTAKTAPLWFLVNTLPLDTTMAPIFDIKMPYAEPLTFAEIAPWVGGSLLLLGLIALIIIYFIKRKKDEPLFFPRKPVEPPHIIAIRELEKVRDKKLWITDNHKHYHTVLTDIIRTYIEGRFSVSAMEQTTEETIRSLKKDVDVTPKLLEGLQDMLSLADLVKFARYTPVISENENGLNFGFRFVNETKVEVISDSKEIVEDQKSGNVDDSSKTLPVEPQKSIEL